MHRVVHISRRLDHHESSLRLRRDSTGQYSQSRSAGRWFQAKTRGDEIPSPGYVVRITEDYRDVSQQVLEVVQPGMDFLARTKAIQKRSRELERQAEVDHPGLRAEVAEMFTGKTYVMFLYTFLKDVRLVFAPPASVGNFGGENDNWEWPRHTGDFSLMRAYTAPDGSSASYNAANVPYKPKRVVKVNPTARTKATRFSCWATPVEPRDIRPLAS